MDRQHECNMETVNRIQRSLELDQIFVDIAEDKWDGWDADTRRMHVIHHAMIEALTSAGIDRKTACKMTYNMMSGGKLWE